MKHLVDGAQLRGGGEKRGTEESMECKCFT
jgi:hypothetical protein